MGWAELPDELRSGCGLECPSCVHVSIPRPEEHTHTQSEPMTNAQLGDLKIVISKHIIYLTVNIKDG